MTVTRFRQLLTVSLVLLVASVVVGLLPGGYSPALADAYASEQTPWPDDGRGWAILLLLLLAVLAAAIAGFIGLFLLKRWGRTLSLSLTLVSLPLYLVTGPTLMSPLEALLIDASNLLWGACLALAYFSPVSARIDAGTENRSLPSVDVA